MTEPKYRLPPAPDEHASTDALVWYAEYQRAALLLSVLAEDHFPDQAALDEWIERQMEITLRPNAEPRP